MVLLRLLSTGKSLMGIGQEERTYHLAQKGALPKFGGKKNPFRATTLPEHSQHAVSEESAAPPVESNNLPERPAAVESVEPESVSESPAAVEPLEPVIDPGPASVTPVAKTTEAPDVNTGESHSAAQPQTVSKVTPVRERKSGFRSALGKLKARMATLCRRSPRAPARAAAPGSSRPLQGELRLESVRVMRNDLSESDIEVVQRVEPAQQSQAPTAMAGAGAAPAPDTAWRRVSTRIFGPSNVR